MRDFFQQRFGIRDELRPVTRAALKSVLLQQSLAEAVDRENAGLVERLRREFQRADAGLRVGVVSEIFFYDLIGGRVALQLHERGVQPCAHAFAQFLRGRRRVGDGEDRLHRRALFQHQPQKKRGDGIGLAGPGARFDERGTLFQRDMDDIKGFHVAGSSAFSMGA